jgi:hypothetical protein
MNFSGEMLEEITRSKRAVHFNGWMYDLVLDRLERSGFKCLDRQPVMGGLEGSVYEHPEKGIVKVFTSRLHGPLTVVEPSPEKPSPKG